jgi:hypothetical protein
LYQFFISERKDEVIGSVVAPEDIPAATQLFTPNWIVQYLVQNSVGRLWMESYPNSKLRQHMPYYIAPAPQEPEVQAELDKIVVRDRTPESLTVLDPACGSGHILVEAFRLLFQIYLERGHREREIPRLIFAHNLFGLDIDDRAAQLACMTLLFEARKHDTRIFTNPPNLKVLAIQQSRDGDRAHIDAGAFSAKSQAKALINCFAEAKTIGSLLRVSDEIRSWLSVIRTAIPTAAGQQDYFESQIIDTLSPLLEQSDLLTRQYDAVIANPPYMGANGMTGILKKHIASEYACGSADLYACFMLRGVELARNGFCAMITMQTWMFMSSYEEMRKSILSTGTLYSMCHFPYDGHSPTVMGINFGTTAWSYRALSVNDYKGTYTCSRYHELDGSGRPFQFPSINERLKSVDQELFTKIPGGPIAYWLDGPTFSLFENSPCMADRGIAKVGLQSGDNPRFLRLWHEVSISKIGFGFTSPELTSDSDYKWYPHNKGGERRKWYGNQDFVVLWENNGKEIRSFTDQNGRPKSYPRSSHLYFRECISWTDLTSGKSSFRHYPSGFVLDCAAAGFFANSDQCMHSHLAYLNSKFCESLIQIISPGLHFRTGYFDKVPVPGNLCELGLRDLSRRAVDIAKGDWDSDERSFNFTRIPTISSFNLMANSFNQSADSTHSVCMEMLDIEREMNARIVDGNNLDPIYKSLSEDDLTLYKTPRDNNGRYIFIKEAKCFVSYAIGCMMGRYSLDHEGLIHAQAGNTGFDPSKYTTFPADADGIIPLTEESWFKDDATERLVEFVSKSWPSDALEENLSFLAKALGAKANESPRDLIRHYLVDNFYKDHCQTYKKRPIYWLFSSGKQRAFQCLVYLHRYHTETLSRMRADYVIPLQGKLQGRLAALTEEVARAGSTAQRKQAQKALDLIDKKIRELAAFDDQLRSYADKRIELNLDDGVKDNIRKFGTLIDLRPLGNLDSEE